MKTLATKSLAYKLLLGLTVLFTLAAVLTLVPNPKASWPNILGYSSLCTFAPCATLICAFLAGFCCTIRARLVRKVGWSGLVPVIVLVIVAGGALAAGLVWADTKSHYSDTVSGASTL